MLIQIVICNLNLAATEQDGCLRLEHALARLLPEAEVTLHHFAQIRRDPVLIARATALVLGPQGTPFSAYDRGFLPWLRALIEVYPGPVLGVCGGMQALALAWGGQLKTTFGENLGDSYTGLQKIRGPLPIQLHPRDLPPWLPDRARRRLEGWQEKGGLCFESHVEQVVEVPNSFVLVAQSLHTPVEAMLHRRRPVMASQFHPELGWDEGCSAGKLWMEAWLDIVRAVA